MFFLINLFKLILIKLRYFLTRNRYSFQYFDKLKNSKKNKILKILDENGYYVIENYFKEYECKKIIKEMDLFIKKYPNKTYLNKLAYDRRIFGAQNINSKGIKKFYYSSFIKTIGSQFYFTSLKNLMTMANRTVFKKKNLGSGDGWHRDSVNKQFKSILYLVDTNTKNGSFQIIKNSHKFLQIVRDSTILDSKVTNTRFLDNKINKLKKRIQSINGKAGTLIIADTSLIHRGSPLKKGIRYALTNYYYPKHLIENYKNHFVPMLAKNEKN